MSRLATYKTLLFAAALASAPAALALDPAKRFADYVIDQWNAQHGIPQISVQSITQDLDGYLWVGTQNGIARFDGVRFKVYDQSSAGIRSVFVRTALTGPDGTLWFGTDQALLRYAGEVFTTLHAPGGAVEFRALAASREGTVLASTARGVLRVGPSGLEPHPALAPESTGETGALLVDGDALWIGVRGAVLRLAHGRLERHAGAALPDRLVTSIARSGESLLLGTDRGLARLERGRIATAFPESALAQSEITSLLADRDGNLWIGTSRALWRHSAPLGLERVERTGFPVAPRIVSLFEDRDGNLWLGSISDSLFRAWNGWIRRLGAADGFSDPLAWSLARDAAGRMLVGTNSDVVVVEDQRVRRLIDGRALPNPAAYELYRDSRDWLWIGTRAGLALWRDGRVEVPPEIAAIGPLQVNVVLEHDGAIWIGTQGGLHRWRDGRAEALTGPEVVPHNRIRALYPIGPDHLLLGTEAGVREWRDGRASVPSWGEPLSDRFVTAIEALPDGLLLLTTFAHGIVLTDRERLVSILERDGLSASSAWLGRVIGGHLYLSSLAGVYRVELESLRAFWQGRERRLRSQIVIGFEGRAGGGLRTRCCNGGASSRALVDDDGLWLPHADGVLHLDVADIHAGARPPSVRIESLRHDGSDLTPAGGAMPRLAGQRRDIEIAYTAIEHRDPTGLAFRYRLDGYDDRWREVGAARSANYTNLPPGAYTFRVAAISSTGLESTAPARLRFEIARRWHEEPALRAAALLALVMLAWSGIKWLTARFRARERLLQQLVAERTAELALANTRLRESNRMLVEENRVDALTGLVNRRHAVNEIDAITARWHRADAPVERCTLFLVINVDYMKRLNERYGTTGADGILRQFAQELQRLAGPAALVPRWGGDEFLVVHGDVPRGDAPLLAERLRQRLVEKLYAGPDGRDVVMPCSVGYAAYPLAPQFGDQVPWIVSVELADAAVQQVKLQGRNAWAGVEVARDTDPALLRHGVAGRTALLTREGRLIWRNLRPRLA